MDLTVSIVSYNTADLVLACIDSVFQHAGGLALEIILVDNASVDGTVDKVRAQYPQVHVIANASNRFFTGGHNQAARVAQGRYLLILNSDTRLLPDTLPSLVHFLDEHSEYGAAGCQEQDQDGNVLSTASGIRTPWVELTELLSPSFVFPGRRQRLLAGYYLTDWDRRSSRAVPVLTDAFLMVRRDLFLKLGAYDESMKLYFTEDDLCLGLRRMGKGTYYTAEVGYIHDRHGSTRKERPRAIERIYSQDRFRYYRKWFGLPAAIAVRAAEVTRRTARRMLRKG